MRHELWRRFGVTTLAVVALGLGGCAVGNRYDYGSSISGLPVSGTGSIAVDVLDARPYVLSGAKKPDFVGLQRGGFGNPFDVRTGSGRPLADEMRQAIVTALEKQGYSAVGGREAAPRRIELRVLEWKTDVMMHMKTLYDLELNVYDAGGALLAKSATKGEDVGGGGFQSQNAANAAKTFELRFTDLVRDEAVRKALSGTPQ